MSILFSITFQWHMRAAYWVSVYVHRAHCMQWIRCTISNLSLFLFLIVTRMCISCMLLTKWQATLLQNLLIRLILNGCRARVESVHRTSWLMAHVHDVHMYGMLLFGLELLSHPNESMTISVRNVINLTTFQHFLLYLCKSILNVYLNIRYEV